VTRQDFLPPIAQSQFYTQPERYMAAADIFCLPNYREGFGQVIIEQGQVEFRL